MYKEWEFTLKDHHIRVTNNFLTGVKLYVDGKLKGRNGFPIIAPLLILLTLIVGGKTVDYYQEKQKIHHIENLLATLPPEERAEFTKKYLLDPIPQLKLPKAETVSKKNNN